MELCKYFLDAREGGEKPLTSVSAAAQLCHLIRRDFEWLQDFTVSTPLVWIQSLGQASDRLTCIVEKVGLEELAKSLQSSGKEKTLAWLSEFPNLPGKLSDCQKMLADYDTLLTLPGKDVSDDFIELAKELGTIATLSSYGDTLLKAVFAEDVVKGISDHFSHVYESLNVGIASIDSELAECRELLAKYRPAKYSSLV